MHVESNCIRTMRSIACLASGHNLIDIQISGTSVLEYNPGKVL